MLKRREFLALLLAPWLASCRSAGAGKGSLPSGLDLGSLDRAVRPQDDLYQFAAGTWLRDTPIPPDRSNYGAFGVLQDQVHADVRAIAEAAGAAPAPAGSDAQRIGDLYLSFMDTARIEAVGLEPLRPELARIGAIDSREALLAGMGHLQTLAVRAPLDVYVEVDPDRPDRHVAAVWQAGIALPDRVYLLEDTPRLAEYRRRYHAYVADIARLAGIADPADAQAIVALETRLARAHRPQEEHRDPGATTNRLSLRDLDALAGVDWRPMLAAAGIEPTELLVGQPGYVEGVGAAVREVPLAAWRRYLAYQLVHAYAPYLASPLAGARFEMFEATLRGVREDRPRWERAVEVLNRNLGDLVGRVYVRKHFPPAARDRIRTVAATLVTALGNYLEEEVTWIGPATKAEARAKLAALDIKVGYPERWRDYEGVRIARDDLVGNLLRAARAEHAHEVARLGRPVDRGEWAITPQTVNAYYARTRNEIVVPAAILRPPFFDPGAEDAVNYGAIGAVIGHEICHGFDAQGRKYDAEGRLRDWWTAADDAEYRRKAALLIQQYDAYEPLPGHRVNGTLTLGENIADLIGLRAAHRAYHLALAGAPSPVLDGFTGDQRLFVAWARIWARKYREDDLVHRLATDPHTPGAYRANGPPSNIDAFYAAFGVGPDDGLYRPPAERVRPRSF
jgi:putative endopeptidase